MKGIDLFAGAGGTTTGAKQAGIDMIWAANHSPIAVDFHSRNHPEVIHQCQDLCQADWSDVPSHDILFASPCCQGHSRAAGKKKTTKKADKSRSTAWAVVDCLEAHRTPVCIVENVPDFLNWQLYNAWECAMHALGYALSINPINACNLGIPQNRNRLFIVATRSMHPIELKLANETMVPARTIVDLSEEGYEWDLVSSRVPATQRRVANGHKSFGEAFLDAAYGSSRNGHSLDKPLCTITCVNKHSLVIGDKIRPLTCQELAAAQTFNEDYIWPSSKVATKTMIGNAVPPKMAQKVTEAVLRAL